MLRAGRVVEGMEPLPASGPPSSSDLGPRTSDGPPPAALVAAIVTGAAAAQVLRPEVTVAVPGAPWNWVLPTLPAVALVLARWRRPEHPLLQVLGSSSWAIAGLLALGLVCLPLAVWPTGIEAPGWLQRIGLADATRSLPFAAVWSVLVINLACVTGLRLAHPAATRAWVRSWCVHAGLLVATVGAVAAAGTLDRGRLVLREGGGPAEGLLREGRADADPFPMSVTLRDFRLESFPPTLAVARPEGASWHVTPGETLLAAGATDRVAGWQVTVEEWLPSCAVIGGQPRPYHAEGAGPAARVTATGPGGALVTGWLHAPTSFGERLLLLLPGDQALMMADPRPRRFSAAVEVDGAPHEIAVNQPLRSQGWTLYLTSYDETLGAASPIAILEAVHDPALPGVYLGLGLLLIGMGIMLWERSAVRGPRSEVPLRPERGNDPMSAPAPPRRWSRADIGPRTADAQDGGDPP